MKRLFAVAVAAILCLAFAAPAAGADPVRPFRGATTGWGNATTVNDLLGGAATGAYWGTIAY